LAHEEWIVGLTRLPTVGVDLDGEIALRAGAGSEAVDDVAHMAVGRDIALDGNCAMMLGRNACPEHGPIVERIATGDTMTEHPARLEITGPGHPRLVNRVAEPAGRECRLGSTDHRARQCHLKKLSTLDRHPRSPGRKSAMNGTLLARCYKGMSGL
jgi:hypothetical protein